MTVEELEKDLENLGRSTKLIDSYIKQIRQKEIVAELCPKISTEQAVKTIKDLLNKEVERISIREAKMTSYLVRLTPDEQEVISLHYINGLPIWKIALQMHYEDRTIVRRLKSAKNKLVAMMNSDKGE